MTSRVLTISDVIILLRAIVGTITLSTFLVAGVESHFNLTYARYDDRELRLDLHRPTTRNLPLPAIICIHGNGQPGGTRASMESFALALATRGFITVSISCQLPSEASFLTSIHDAKAAVRWLRAHATAFGIDVDAIGVAGLSADGQLAALLATSGGVMEFEGVGGHPLESSAVQACVAIETGRLDAPALSSAHRHLDRGDPPLAFISSELDEANTRSGMIRRDLMKLGIATGLTVLPQASSRILGQPHSLDLAVNACAAFFTRHLMQRNGPLVETTMDDSPFAPNARWTMVGGGYAGCEGAQWVGDTLHFAAHHDRFAFTWVEGDGIALWRDASPEATAFRPDGTGGFYVADQTNRRLVRWNAAGETIEVLAERFEGKRLNRPNDAIVKSDGTVWFTDPDFLFNARPTDAKELGEQNVYRFNPRTRQLTAAARGFGKPNGLAFSPDERSLFITDSAGRDILRFTVATDGSLGPREVFATLAVQGLDGLAFDPSGRLWCAALDGVHVFDTVGRDLGTITLPAKPTSIAFAASAKRVCVTTRDAAYVATLR